MFWFARSVECRRTVSPVTGREFVFLAFVDAAKLAADICLLVQSIVAGYRGFHSFVRSNAAGY